MSFRSSQEYAILGVLMTGPKHGYELHGYICSKMNQFWHLSMSQAYALLKRMENSGLVASKEELQENRPTKKIFTITQKGTRRFLQWVSSPVEHVRDLRIEFMAKLFFVIELQLKEGLSLFDKQIEVLQDKLRMIDSSKENVDDEFQALLYSFKSTLSSTVLDWLNECKASFSPNEKRGIR